MDTFPEVTALPLAGVKVNVPVPTVPVKVIPKLDKLATPLLKSPALDNLFVPDNPVILPVKLVDTEILFPEASKPVTTLPYASKAVKVLLPVKATPLAWEPTRLTANLEKLAGLTVIGKLPPTLELIEPSDT
ncbi:hypothetical protein AQBE111736_13850 [Aquirufa beregesia]